MTAPVPGLLLFYMVLGIVAGVLSGAMGVGSGILVVPALVLFCHLSQQTAQGTALAVMVPMALIGAIRYWMAGDILTDYRLAGLLILGAAIGALAGSGIALRLPADILRKAFAVLMVVLAVKMFFAPSQKAGAPVESNSIERIDTHDHR